jgi:hypothetical protein
MRKGVLDAFVKNLKSYTKSMLEIKYGMVFGGIEKFDLIIFTALRLKVRGWNYLIIKVMF